MNRSGGPRHVLAIDQGTTSSRAMVFDEAARVVAVARRELPQHYPQAGWVEQDAATIWRDSLAVARDALAQSGVAVAAIGIANQRETVVVWDRATGEAIHPAIVWQDRRTATICESLRAQGAEPLVRERSGLLLDPYFSATKLGWILDHVPGARAGAEAGALAFGTIDSFLLWHLTGGAVHATDATNASRTLLFDITRQCWDPDLLRLFDIPAALLPDVRDSSGLFGHTAPGLFPQPIPIAGMAGDQQAALFGQGCFTPGMVKSTYGTGCFALIHTGDAPVFSNQRLLTTVACRLDGRPTYAVEGAIFVAGAAVKWLRDGLGLIGDAAETAALAASLADSHGVYLVPGFVGLGAPHWDPHARGLICGLTLDSSAAHLARAALESAAYQTLDLLSAMQRDGTDAVRSLRVDGGMVANDWFCQFLADILQVPVERPAVPETTALGAAFLAGLAVGLWPSLPAIGATLALERRFTPAMPAARRDRLVAGWADALRRALLPAA